MSDQQKNIHFVGDYLMNILTKFGSNWPCGFREEKWKLTDDTSAADDGHQVMTIPHIEKPLGRAS